MRSVTEGKQQFLLDSEAPFTESKFKHVTK